MGQIRRFRRKCWRLERVLFSVQPPGSADRSKVFSARDKEYERVENLVIDSPRNVLVSGAFGIGKTVFLEELVSRIGNRYGEDVMAIYVCLDSLESDLLAPILRALASRLRPEDKEAGEICALLDGITLETSDSKTEKDAITVGVPTYLSYANEGQEGIVQKRARSAVPDAAHKIRELLCRAEQRRPRRRILVAVDDLDKRDPASVRKFLVEARPTLHSNCAFVLTGHPLGVFRSLYSTAGAVFDYQLELPVMPPEQSRALIAKYLRAGRVWWPRCTKFHPFTEEAVTAIVDRSFGIPRLMNKICLLIMQVAAEERIEVLDLPTLQSCWEQVGRDLRQSLSEDAARLFEFLYQ